MGANARRRREARRRERPPRQDGWAGTPNPPGPGPNPFPGPHADDPQLYGRVELHVRTRIRMIGARRLEADELRSHATMLLRHARPAPWHVVQTVMGDVLARATSSALAGGWPPGDLVELVTRCGHPSHVPLLLTALHEESPLRIRNLDVLGSALQVVSLLHNVPVLDSDAVSLSEEFGSHPKLAKVRALLAKAESTQFDEEAEALTAKAQELISRYALGQLLEHSGPSRREKSDLVVRRLWLDPPYVGSKASLVHAVATANRCRAAVAERFGFCLVVGSEADLHAVELLVTSLLLQADSAMLRHGHRSDRSGIARTRSFRRSFLLAYATRIGERLREANESVTAEHGGDLLPVLRDHAERVSDAFDAMVPHTERKASPISNGEGWVAGLAAADLAQLDVNAPLAERVTPTTAEAQGRAIG